MCIVTKCMGCDNYDDSAGMWEWAWFNFGGKQGYCHECDPIPVGWTYTPVPVKFDTGPVPEELKWMEPDGTA